MTEKQTTLYTVAGAAVLIIAIIVAMVAMKQPESAEPDATGAETSSEAMSDPGYTQTIGVDDSHINDRLHSLTDDQMLDLLNQTLDLESQRSVETEAAPAGATELQTAPFVSRAFDVSGDAKILQTSDGMVLRLENLNTTNGPELHVYLTSGYSDEGKVDLGLLTAPEGSMNFAIPEGTDFNTLKKVLIWSEPFGVIYSYAEFN